MRQQTQLINALRAHMAELGIEAAQGREGVKELLKITAINHGASADGGMPDIGRRYSWKPSSE
jgi:hypothetical protein